MEIDLDYEEVQLEKVYPVDLADEHLEIIRRAAKLNLTKFTAKDVGVKWFVLRDLWRMGLMRRWKAVGPRVRQRSKWSLRYDRILPEVRGNPELHCELQEKAQRQQSNPPGDWGRHRLSFLGREQTHQRTPHPKRRGS